MPAQSGTSAMIDTLKDLFVVIDDHPCSAVLVAVVICHIAAASGSCIPHIIGALT